MQDALSLKELPRGWVWTTLGEVVDSTKGKKPSSFVTPDNALALPYINIKAFESKVFEQYTDEKALPICEPKDVLIVWDGARCGLVGTGVNGIVGSTIARLNTYELDSSYLLYFLKTKFQYINLRPRGVGIPHVEPNLFWKIPLPVAPLPEQHRIVAKIEELLTKLDAGIEALKKIQIQLKRYRQSVLKSAFSGELTAEWRKGHKSELEPASVLLEKIETERRKKLGSKYKELPHLVDSELSRLSEGWMWTRLEDITILITDGKHGDCQNEPDSGYYFLSAKDIKNGLLNYDNARQITYQDFLQVHKRTDLKPGGICIVNTGSIGKTAIATSDARTTKTTFQKSVAVIKIVEGYVLAKYIELVLKNDLAGLVRTSKGSAVQNLLLGDLKNMPIPLAPLSEQQIIVAEIDRYFSIADVIENTIEQSLKRADRLRQGILKRAFGGKLVHQNPDDEPAEKLLDRIKAERAKRVLKSKQRGLL